jgi:excisionase family DNA binding protein
MKLAENRFDPALIDPGELQKLETVIEEEERPALIGREGVRIDLPEPIYHLLVRTVRAMTKGKTIILLPEDETFTTQAAANFLGVSRQFLVQLLEKNAIPHYHVGTHRRVYLRELVSYQKERDQNRRKTLDQLFRKVDEAGVYDAELPAEK